MLRSHLVLGAMGAAALLLSGLTACGDSGTNTGGAGGQAPAGGVEPPGPPSDGVPGDGSGTVFGTTHIYIGTKTRSGTESGDAWKDYGYDLDGQITAGDFTKHCKPAGGAAPANVFPDGNEGRDNAFGKVLLPIIKTAAMTSVQDLEAELNNAISGGSFNIMLNITDLGTAENYDPLNTLLLAGKEGVGTTWKAAPEFLNNPADINSSKVKFPESYLNANTWVSGSKGTLTLSIAIAGFDLDLNINSAVISMELDAGHTTATNGVIAGVLNTAELVDQLRSVIGAVDPSFCEGAAVEGILNQITMASDIMADGTQDPNATCDGISIGLGFDAGVVTLDGVGMPAEPGTPPCQGTGGAGGGGGAGGAP
ncbi:MAG: hypothetical protein U0271_25145 [Polyangiaceae bacterium]